ncbi:hypothetical protein CEUSTIGMA_g8426.t1 [Chlamydomonas eustigma]|uniref:Peptidase M20 dimerisation domain-containing protein n=1 Tax=Chlamydomonas eustigma TaxID=1157962 RepID=A0A250XD39_9CHLO|nr:hypothetical protein CEUSTIGMA_g8426.t1 [Chlamydomonas eustigma]|eukprot:GAX80991.1 hypothetical protein CEUSTIGMA_g8426.t1 [Chlamydomonas eustigma]
MSLSAETLDRYMTKGRDWKAVEQLYQLAVAGHVSSSGLGLEPVQKCSTSCDPKCKFPAGIISDSPLVSTLPSASSLSKRTNFIAWSEQFHNSGVSTSTATDSGMKTGTTGSSDNHSASCAISDTTWNTPHHPEVNNFSKKVKRDKRPRITYQVELSYFGPGFCGWMEQPGGIRTVEGAVVAGLRKVLPKSVGRSAISSAGRTDKGVSAIGQVFSFHTREDLTPEQIAQAIEAEAEPGLIRVVSVSRRPRSFHATFGAKWRRYVYLFPLRTRGTMHDQETLTSKDYNLSLRSGELPENEDILQPEKNCQAEDDGTQADKIDPHRVLGEIDVQRVSELLSQLVGKTLNYSAFARDTPPGKNCVCTLHVARATVLRTSQHRMTSTANHPQHPSSIRNVENDNSPESGEFMCVELVADRFIRRMVRVLVATAIDLAVRGGHAGRKDVHHNNAGVSPVLTDSETLGNSNGLTSPGLESLLDLAIAQDRSKTARWPAPAIGLCFVGTLPQKQNIISKDSIQCIWSDDDLNKAVLRFSKLLQFKTVSSPDTETHALHVEEFKRLDEHLKTSYPSVWSSLTVEKTGVGNHSYLITWAGSDKSLDPALFISHIDVVPVDPDTEGEWTHGPFSGDVAEGYIWGRGAMDVKIGVAGLLEAASWLLLQGFKPTRTLMFAFGQDEEVGGEMGAGPTAQLLASRGIQLDIILDEGLGISVDGYPPYTDYPLALVGTAEKGYASIEIQINTVGGHSSAPAIDGSSVADIMGRILTSLSLESPRPTLVSPVTDFLKAIAPHAKTEGLKELFENCDDPSYRYEVLYKYLLVDSPGTAAMAHTTVAVTGIKTGIADNVLPPHGIINVNFRLLPGDTEASLYRYLERLVDSDAKYVTLAASRNQAASLASDVTSVSGRHWKLLEQAINSVYQFKEGPPELAPLLMSGGTDSKHYANLTKNGILRFVPTTNTALDAHRVHGVDERTAIQDFGRAVCVYQELLHLFSEP